MAIEQKYLDIIEQCEARQDELSEWERGFVMGEPGNKKKPPIKSRPYLSMGQKQILDRIVVERFEGGKWDNKKIRVDYGTVNAVRTDDGWKVLVADYPVGFGITRKEAVIVTAWLNSALRAILSVPTEELPDFLDGQKAEVPEEGELEDSNPGAEEPDNDDEPF